MDNNNFLLQFLPTCLKHLIVLTMNIAKLNTYGFNSLLRKFISDCLNFRIQKTKVGWLYNW